MEYCVVGKTATKGVCLYGLGNVTLYVTQPPVPTVLLVPTCIEADKLLFKFVIKGKEKIWLI